MNIEIKRTKKNSALLRAMANDDILEAYKARKAFAAYITEPAQEVIDAVDILSSLFTKYEYMYGEPSMIPLAPFYDVRDAGYLRVWTQGRPGGLASSSAVDVTEFPVTTWNVEGAMNLPLNFIRASRVDVIAAYLDQLTQNFVVKSETNSAAVIANMAATTTYQLRGTATQQVYRTLNQGTVLPQDLSAVERILTRVNAANVGGATPAGASQSVTTLVGSPEFAETLRNMAFEPLNNTLRASLPLAGPEKFRNEIYEAGAKPTIYGMEIVVLNNLGTNQTYNILFADAAGTTTYAGYAAGTAVAFSPGSEQVVFCINKRRKGLAVITETNPDDGSSLKILSDNQFSVREETVGFYARKREGRVGVDGRGLISLIF